ncbi:MAG: class I SAM-dependent methyltransferase [Alphaproteobacteria bacterium]|nr:class I SAM-dependent methyltransferase [Alphaproteobacteria bacterium]MBM3624103.1 class I SAM-dependent methyltransferase [Alphaproteobacteria bacterium]
MIFAAKAIEQNMSRQEEILKHASKGARGIELGPYFSPLAAKRDGYNCLYLDVFDTETIQRRAAADPFLTPEQAAQVESVDLVGDAMRIDELCRNAGETEPFDYIISANNFEHLPNPIKFLQACGRVLKTGGFLSVVVPQKSGCLDFYRPRTSLTAWIEAFFEERERPTHAQIFEQVSMIARGAGDAGSAHSFSFIAERNLREAFDEWSRRRLESDATYFDVHCSAFTPNSFRLLFTDAYFLGLSPFVVEEVIDDKAQGGFYAHLRKDSCKTFSQQDTDAHYANRQHILQQIIVDEANVIETERISQIFESMSQRYGRAGARRVLALPRAFELLLRARDVKLVKPYLAVKSSALFDPAFYAERVRFAGDGAMHYLLRGAKEGLDPGPFFSTSGYLRQNPDVARNGANPLAHYELFGRKEGRKLALR